MKTLKMVFFLAMLSSFALCQNKPTVDIQSPQFICQQENPGICAYLKQNISYPPVEEKYMVEGTVVVKFSVLPSGDLSDFEIVNSLTENCDKAVLNTIKSTQGMWKPALMEGKPVKQETEIAVAFRINGNNMYRYAEFCRKKAENHMQKKNYKKAIKLYNKSIQIDPYNTQALAKRALASYHCGDNERALRDFERLTALGGQTADQYLIMVEKAN